jgi:carbon-monoxide dehydrogenase small subunit
MPSARGDPGAAEQATAPGLTGTHAHDPARPPGSRSRPGGLMTRIQLDVDGVRYDDDVEARTLLVHHLRDRIGKVGTVVGCDTSNCGACTVLLDGASVKSCSVLAVQADGKSVTTIEGLAEPGGALHPVQRAFHERHALQCGFCTPGMIMASVSLLADNPDPTDTEIREGLEGNLCRCTGYQNIVRAVHDAAAALRDAVPAAGPVEVPAQAAPAERGVTV